MNDVSVLVLATFCCAVFVALLIIAVVQRQAKYVKRNRVIISGLGIVASSIAIRDLLLHNSGAVYLGLFCVGLLFVLLIRGAAKVDKYP
jgi:ABC-type enterobactin transport system permease subunit